MVIAETSRDAKEWIPSCRGGDSETIDHSVLAPLFGLALARHRSQSFAKLERALQWLIVHRAARPIVRRPETKA